MTPITEFDSEYIQQRLRQLEEMERDYRHCHELLDYAAKGDYLDTIVDRIVLYVQPDNQQIVETNTKVATFLGYAPEELLALSIDELEVPGSQKEPTTYVESSIEIQLYDGRYRHRDGHELNVQVHRWPISKDDQTLICYVLEEKSLRTRLWHELNRREDTDHQFREKLKTLNEITLELGQLNSFDSICKRAVELGIQKLGFDRLSLWFLDPSQTRMIGSFGVDEAGQIRDERKQSWAFARSYIEDFIHGKREPIVSYDSAPLYNESSEIIGYGWHISAPIVDGNQFIGLIGADNFIHKQSLKSFQPELLRLYGATIGHLKVLNQAREKELALRLEQERTRMLETFVADIRHEFKTPLAVINTSNYIAAKSPNENQRQKHTEIIATQVKILDTMLQEILDIVNLTSTPTFTAVPLNLDEFMQNMINYFMPTMQEKGLTWQVELASQVIIQADERQLARAVSEILENAIQFTPAPGTIHISLHPHGAQVSIEIQDTGIGIPAEEKENIFDRFYRVDKARTIRSTGLGLTIARLIIEAHHGKILVESVTGEGSRFEIVLPIHGPIANHERL